MFKKLLAILSFGLTSVLFQQIVRLIGWGDYPFGLQSQQLTSSSEITPVLLVISLVAVIIFTIGIFSLVKDRRNAIGITIIGITALGVAAFVASLLAITF
ncbi:MAG TPA: hypothetical protein VLF41_01105 [Candidatus Nanoarchaeia archaeon]|nr:hypothetical protein [Candidatus Nanoarchaeia archaeon]